MELGSVTKDLEIINLDKLDLLMSKVKVFFFIQQKIVNSPIYSDFIIW